MEPIRPDKTKEIEVFATEYVRCVRLKAQYRTNRWCRDAWSTILDAIEDESRDMRDAGPCAVRIYQKLVELAFSYLKAQPNVANSVELLDVIEIDVEVLGLRYTVLRLMSKLDGTPLPLTKQQQTMVEVAIIHLNHLALQLEKQTLDTS
jgi:hypothetical protein